MHIILVIHMRATQTCYYICCYEHHVKLSWELTVLKLLTNR